MDGGEEKVEDQALQAELRGQAREVYFMAVLAAALLTVLCVAAS